MLEPAGEKALAIGYHPSATARSLELIPKRRYQFMNLYLGERDIYGPCMMRGSASTQVSIDYTSTADCLRKLRLAFALVPMLSLMCDNAPVFEGKPREHQLVRTDIWQHVDNDRCGSVPGLFDEGYGFEDYAEWILRTCPIFVTRPSADDPTGPNLRAVYGQSAYEAYGDAPMTRADIEHVLSMFWPDVRLKNFVEIRPADSLSAPLMAGYAALVKGIFYSQRSLQAIEEAFGVAEGVWPLTDDSANQALKSIQEDGAEAVICGKTLVEWQELIFEIADGALDEEDAAHLHDLVAFARSRR